MTTTETPEMVEPETVEPATAGAGEPAAGPEPEVATPPAAAKAPAAAPAAVPRVWRSLALTCALIAAASLAAAGFFAQAWWSQRSSSSSSQQEAAQVRSTAGAFVSALTNFDPGTVNTDFTRIQSYATGAFATQAKQFFGSSIRQQLQSAGAASRGQIADLFVESLSGTQATVFAVVNQTYLNDKMTSPAADTLRLELVMSDLASGWHISAVTVLQSPNGFPTPTPTTKPKG